LIAGAAWVALSMPLYLKRLEHYQEVIDHGPSPAKYGPMRIWRRRPSCASAASTSVKAESLAVNNLPDIEPQPTHAAVASVTRSRKK
jgi:hypothetical protein